MNKLNWDQQEQFKEIGAYLRQKRLESSLSLEQIAAKTYIRASQLKAIEEGNLEKLPELVYVECFIRRYGEVLKIDGTALAQKLVTSSNVLEDNSEPVETKTETNAEPVLIESLNFKIYALYLLLLLGAISSLLYLLSQVSNLQSTSQVSQSLEETSSVTPVSPSTPEPIETAAIAAPISVTLTLEDSSWLRVTVDGKTDFEGILEKGTTKTWTATKELRLRAGNAGAVKLSFNQQPPQLLGRLGQVKDLKLTPELKTLDLNNL